MMEDLKKEEKPVFINGDSKILTYAEKVVEDSRYVHVSEDTFLMEFLLLTLCFYGQH